MSHPQKKAYWLMKSEPDVFSIDDLKKSKTTLWDGVRNYQARNYMTREMRDGDLVLFYHSNAVPSGVAGLAVVVGPAQVDPSQFDRKSPYFDAKATPEKPIWFCVQIKYKKKFKRFISLTELRKNPTFGGMRLLEKGSRLSIQPVAQEHFLALCEMGEN